MPFWLVKLSVSPDCSVPDEIVTVAPVRSVSVRRYASRPSRPPPPSRRACRCWSCPTGVDDRRGDRTLTLSAARNCWSSEPSTATIEIDRVDGAGAGGGERDRLQGRLILGGRGAAAQGQHAAGVAAGDAVLIGEIERVARLERAGRDRRRVAPVRSVSLELTVTPESTATGRAAERERVGRARRRHDGRGDDDLDALGRRLLVQRVVDERRSKSTGWWCWCWWWRT